MDEGSGSDLQDRQNYIFGYGSLIENESRQRTTPSAKIALPARVTGIRRGWWARGVATGLTTTYLGALMVDPRSHPPVKCNGVIYKVTPEELAETDRRESANYQRRPVDSKNIEMLDGSSGPPSGLVWAYISKITKLDDNLPTFQFPIVQSYVDICIHGCFEVEKDYPKAAGFAQDFIATTDAWSRFWVNDRLYPRRPFIFQPAAEQIDATLAKAEKTKDLFYEVEIEPARWEDLKPVRPK